MIKVLLTGINGTYNYGCEAIIRGTIEILTSLFRDIQVDYLATNRSFDDKLRLNGCNVRVRTLKDFSFIRFYSKKILRKLRIPFEIEEIGKSDIGKYDMVLSIGGDIYTIWSNGGYAKKLIHFGDYCQNAGVPYILWGCSVGPFEENLKIKEIFKKHLTNVSLIVAREQTTVDYLRSMNVARNVILSFDPAFSVPSPKLSQSIGEKILGINLSPLSLKYLKVGEDEAIKEHSNIIISLIREYNWKVLLIPHVVKCENRDNDLYYLKKIYENIPSEIIDQVSIISNDPGFVGLKTDIQRCKAVIAARMHCAINAISSGVPAIFLSYSEKSRGMSRMIYGTDDYCLPLEAFKENNVELLDNLFQKVYIPNDLNCRIKEKGNLKTALEQILQKKSL